MISVERRYNNLRDSHPYTGDVVLFNTAVMYQKFNESTIRKWFNKLVSKDEYQRSDKEEIIDQAIKLSALAEKETLKK